MIPHRIYIEGINPDIIDKFVNSGIVKRTDGKFIEVQTEVSGVLGVICITFYQSSSLTLYMTVISTLTSLINHDLIIKEGNHDNGNN